MAFTVKIIEKDRGWKRIQGEIKKMKNSFVKVGVLSDSGSYEATEGGAANLADVATFMEFGFTVRGGSYFVLPRPFLRQAFDNNIDKIKDFISKEQDAIYRGASSTSRSLEKLGLFFAAKVKAEITDGKFPPNAPSTIKEKGSSKPLIDTGRLRASINHEVVLK